jgi:hypothetical protein
MLSWMLDEPVWLGDRAVSVSDGSSLALQNPDLFASSNQGGTRAGQRSMLDRDHEKTQIRRDRPAKPLELRPCMRPVKNIITVIYS